MKVSSAPTWKNLRQNFLGVERPHPIHYDQWKIFLWQFFSWIFAFSTSNERSQLAENMSLHNQTVKIQLCGAMRWSVYKHAHQTDIITKHLQSLVMYGLPWEGLPSWLRFSTRERAVLRPDREITISMVYDLGVIVMKLSHRPLDWPHALMTHRGGILKTISQQLYYIIFSTSTIITVHDVSSWRNLFLANYLISASLFVFRRSNTKLSFAIYLCYFWHMLRHDQVDMLGIRMTCPLSLTPFLFAHLDTSSLDFPT